LPLWAVTGASFLFTIGLFWRVALTDQLLLRRDMLRVVLPLKSFWAERIRAGQLPEWYPYDGLGQPFAGMMVSGAFHPGNALFLVLHVGPALTWNALLCFPVMACGLWLLLRRAGVSRMACALGVVLGTFNGYAVCITNSLPYLQAMALVPWALFAVMRFVERPGIARGVAGALALSLVLFAGDTQSFLIACALTCPIALWLPSRHSAVRRLSLFLGLMGLTAVVALPQLVAAAHVLRESLAAKRSLPETLIFSLHPWRLLEMLVGPLFGTGELYQDASVTEALLHSGLGGMWVESVHFGAVGLVLAAAGLATLPGARLRIGAGLTVAGALLLVLGKYGGLYGVFYRLFWLWRPFRYPEKLLPYLFLALAALAALGLDGARRNAVLGRWVGRCASALSVALMLLAGSEVSLHAFTRVCQWVSGGALGVATTAELGDNLVRACGLTIVALLATAWAVRAPSASRRGWLVPGVCALVAFIQGEPLYGAVSPEVLEETPLTVQVVQEREGEPHLGGARVYSAVGSHAIAVLEGLSFDDGQASATTTGLEPVTPAWYHLEGANAYLPAASARLRALQQSGVFLDRVAGLFSASYVAVSSRDYRGDGRYVLARSNRLQTLLLANPGAVPRLSLRSPLCVASEAEALRHIVDPSFQAATDAVVECGSQFLLQPTERATTAGLVRFVSYDADRVEIDATTATSQLLVLADAYYSGWSATVDGKPTAILPANLAGRGLLLGPGPHRVVFSYRTPGLRLALGVSAATVLLGAGFGLAGWFRARRRRPG
jgi:hypothetical protein